MNLCTVIAFFLSSIFVVTDVFAELKVQSLIKENRVSGYTKGDKKQSEPYWIFPGEVKTESGLHIQNFFKRNNEKEKFISTPRPLFGLSQVSTVGSHDLLIMGFGYEGDWDAVQLDVQSSKVKKSVAIKSISFATEVAPTTQGYVIGGIDLENQPTLVLLNKALTEQKTISIGNRKKGEVSGFLNTQDKLFALVNYVDTSAELGELLPSGEWHSRMSIKGALVMGTFLRNGAGLALTYRVGDDVMLERLDTSFKSLWKVKLHEARGVSTLKNRVLDLPNGIGWVGGNDDRLVIYRINLEGKITRQIIDQATQLFIPAIGYYSSHVLNDEIHVRGQAGKRNDPVDGNGWLFHLVEK